MATSSRNSFSRFCGAPSISKRESFFGIRLGPYEPQARDVLFGAAPLSSLRAFQVIAQRYENEKISVESIASYPVRHGKGAWNVYSLSVGGFGFIAKLDNRPFLGTRELHHQRQQNLSGIV